MNQILIHNTMNETIETIEYNYSTCKKNKKELCCVCSIISLLMTFYMIVFYKLIEDYDGGSLINF